MALSDVFTKQIKWSGKAAGDKHSDGGGLFLHVTKAGKYWRMAYRFGGKQKLMAFGVYPAVSLAQARKLRDSARELLAQGVDPGTVKRQEKAVARFNAENTFETIAREFHEKQISAWSPAHADKWIRSLELDLFPAIGRLPLTDITPPILLDALQRVERRGAGYTAHALGQRAGQVFRYGIQTGRCDRNPAPDLQGALKPFTVKHMAAVLEPMKVGALMRAMNDYPSPITRAALLLSALLFQRPGNIRAMKWEWVDLDNAMLTIPAADMKRTKAGKENGRPHYVPLSRQSLHLLRELQPITAGGEFVFSATRGKGRPMSENTITAALRRMDYTGDDMTAHGFRAMARTMLAERIKGVNPEVVEAQLAHGKSGALGMAYDRAEYMEQRRTIMQTWADYLDKLAAGATVVQLRA